jgi:hypothetical protein
MYAYQYAAELIKRNLIMEKHRIRIKSWRTIAFVAIVLALSGFIMPSGTENADSYGCSYTIILTVAPNSTGSWCMQGGSGSQLYQADGNGIATFTNICLGTYYFCDASGTVYTVIVDGSALVYYPVAASLRCPC